MGLLSKSDVKKLKREKREKKALKKRNVSTRPKIVRFLIVCEGEKTEPNYFKTFIKNQYSEVTVSEKGRSTCSLVKKTLEIKEDLEYKRQLPFDRVWVVFDKDDFNDFNEAIELAKKHSFHCAWSNESFELWYFLHFQYLDTGISRHDYIDKLQDQIRTKPGYENYQYKKNDPSVHNLLNKIGDEKFAKDNAKKLRARFKGDKDFKNHKPCTYVDLLVGELENPELLLAKKTK